MEKFCDDLLLQAGQPFGISQSQPSRHPCSVPRTSASAHPEEKDRKGAIGSMSHRMPGCRVPKFHAGRPASSDGRALTSVPVIELPDRPNIQQGIIPLRHSGGLVRCCKLHATQYPDKMKRTGLECLPIFS